MNVKYVMLKDGFVHPILGEVKGVFANVTYSDAYFILKDPYVTLPAQGGLMLQPLMEMFENDTIDVEKSNVSQELIPDSKLVDAYRKEVTGLDVPSPTLVVPGS